ncbi:hypothetical protein LPN04_06370 [Rugamonas sp. A1-17]|nr:hypothetical protein [Rugamonas sp. A1-17]
MMRRALRLAVAAALACACAVAGAHNFHMGIADISYNARTGNTEIVHTYTAHDVAILLTNLYGRNFDLGQADSEAPLRRYVERQFYLEGPDGQRLPLHWVGMKADADSIVIFQEVEGRKLAPATHIHNALLVDFLPSQKNTVNLQADGPVQTLIFDQGSVDQTTR